MAFHSAGIDSPITLAALAAQRKVITAEPLVKALSSTTPASSSAQLHD